MAFDREIACLTCFCEASSATPEERRCVMHVIFNRLHAGRFGRTIADVCLARYQFSEWLDDAGDSANLRRGARAAADDPVMKDCLAAFDEVATGGKPDPTGNSTHYHDRSIAPPAWAQPPASVTLSTQHFIFYRGVP